MKIPLYNLNLGYYHMAKIRRKEIVNEISPHTENNWSKKH
jgi:hypothetical protein